MKAVHETIHNGKPLTVVHNDVEERTIALGLPNRYKIRKKLHCKCCGREWFADMHKAHLVSEEIEDSLEQHYSNITSCSSKVY